jgi:four helix bundle protein
MKDFRNLKVWQKAHELVLQIYKATQRSPQSELYGLTSQLRRSSASIPTNLAEGYGRDGDAEFARFVQIAMGSASEVEYQLLLSRDLTFLGPTIYEDLNAKIIEIKRMLTTFLQTLRTSKKTRSTQQPGSSRKADR